MLVTVTVSQPKPQVNYYITGIIWYACTKFGTLAMLIFYKYHPSYLGVYVQFFFLYITHANFAKLGLGVKICFTFVMKELLHLQL